MSDAAATPEGSLLLTLEEISHLISHSRDHADTLLNTVRLIQRRFQTDVCSVYLLDPDRGDLVLSATVGLKPESVGRVRMQLREGLTGLVAERMAPVMVADAFQHPRFKYFPEAGEDPYHSFLGVPLVETGELQGVLVVQTIELREFSASEVRMLVTVASQLAPLASGARLLEKIISAVHAPAELTADTSVRKPSVWQAVPLSPGIGLGCAYVIDGNQWHMNWDGVSTGVDSERRRLAQAVDGTRDELARLSQHISSLVGQYHGAIMEAQLMILQDRAVASDLDQLLMSGATAESALLETLEKYTAVFQQLSDPHFRERQYDIKDVFRRVLWHLRPGPVERDSSRERLVLVGLEASVTALFSVDLDRLAAVVVQHGGPQSHAAIIARSLNVPMVGQAAGILSHVRFGQLLLVDGTSGAIHVDPGPDLIAVHGQPVAQGPVIAPAPAVAQPPHADGPKVEANINLLGEATQAVQQNADGVGLYRTEFLFLARRTLPTEDEQVGIYRQLLTLLKGRPATIRTFDLRADKIAHLTSAGSSFDWRLFLDSAPMQQLFKEQLRAILRAATAGPARILVPLLLRTQQLDLVREIIAHARRELREEGLEHESHVPMGVMIEVAAAAVMVERWADGVDFFAIGTNDLLASALGIDRDNPVGQQPDDLLHPGWLSLIHDAVAAAHKAGRRITVCGEMAADPDGALALAACGADSLSVAVNHLSAVRSALAKYSQQSLAALLPQLVQLRTGNAVRQVMRQLDS